MTGDASACWIDTHCHLDDDAFDGIRDETLAAAAAAGVRRVVNIGYCEERWDSTLALGAAHRRVSFALGIHPGHAGEFCGPALDRLADLCQAASPCAIGEIGMDFYWNGPPAPQQETALREQLRLARALGLPAVIHQRAAEAEILAVFASEPALPPLILHSFDGSEPYVRFAIAANAMFGVGGLATKQASASLRTLLEMVPVHQILLETDAPYLIPAGARGRRNMPANVPLIGRRMCALWGLDEREFARVTTANARRAFGFLPEETTA
ncbi:MAG: TatD family hydrolase [Chloroflexota bacterium]